MKATRNRYRKITALVAGAVFLMVAIGIAGAIAYDALFSGRSALQFSNTTFPGPDTTTLHAYFTAPPGNGPHPAVLLIHEWWGLNEDIVSKANNLAAEGYAVIAVDAWRGVSTRSIPRAVLQIASTSQERVSGDLDAALRYLTSSESVDPKRIAVMGFCYGGGQSLRFAVRHPELAATILFYGELITDPAALASLRGGSLLGIFGANDMTIPVERVRAFEKTLTNLHVASQITIYPDVGHAFANQESAISRPGAAQEAWNQSLGFLNDHVKNRGH